MGVFVLVEAQTTPRPFTGIAHTDAWPNVHLFVRDATTTPNEELFAIDKINAIERLVDGKSLCELGGAGTKLSIQLEPSAASHLIEAGDGLECANQTRRGHFLSVRDDVEAPMHPVDEIHVGVTAVEPHGGISLRAAAVVAMAGAIGNTKVGLDLDDAAGELLSVGKAPHENVTEQRPRERYGVPAEETAGEPLALHGESSRAAVSA